MPIPRRLEFEEFGIAARASADHLPPSGGSCCLGPTGDLKCAPRKPPFTNSPCSSALHS